MKTQPEHGELWDDLCSEMAPPAFRKASLELTLAAMRRHRRRQRLSRLTAIAGGPGLALLGLVLLHGRDAVYRRGKSNGSAPQASAQALPVVPGTHIRLITDEELFAMFPGRPAALLGDAENRQFVLLDVVAKSGQNPQSPVKKQSL